MKNLKTAAVIAIVAMNIVSIIISIDYYKNFFESLFSSASYYSFMDGLQTGFFIIGQIFELTLCFVFLVGAANVKDKAYILLRFFFVIYYFLHLPLIIASLVQYGGYSPAWQIVYTVAMRLISLFCVIAFLIAKPERPVAKIDLSDYGLVAFTSTGHRFLHRLLDGLFIVPLILPWMQFLGAAYRSETIAYLVAITVYFLYYFMSEAIFRQTFGKICTNSCVVSNGIGLSTGRIFMRTLSRYIPFDPLSFLWKGNWHDSVSSTNVVYVNTWEKVFDDGVQNDKTVENRG